VNQNGVKRQRQAGVLGTSVAGYFGVINLLAPRAAGEYRAWRDDVTFCDFRFDFVDASTGQDVTLSRTFFSFCPLPHAAKSRLSRKRLIRPLVASRIHRRLRYGTESRRTRRGKQWHRVPRLWGAHSIGGHLCGHVERYANHHTDQLERARWRGARRCVVCVGERNAAAANTAWYAIVNRTQDRSARCRCHNSRVCSICTQGRDNPALPNELTVFSRLGEGGSNNHRSASL
jgi:hypothetical protein